ncbi:hypothetical protein GCM10010129_24420 [Streptomyces fumigatiscleroticus]|nr:hypothetical protein GCM10010129_24420 [Streptomyces fumigatiscleroticus]
MGSRRLHGRLGTAVGPALAVLAAMLLGRAWNACDTGLFWSGTTYDCPGGVPPWWPGFLPAPGWGIG